MSFRFALVAVAVLAPVAAVAAPYHPEFMVPDSPERNAAAVALWFCFVGMLAGFVMHVGCALHDKRTGTRRAAINVERARLRVRRRVA